MLIDPAFKKLLYENGVLGIKPDEEFIDGEKGKRITEKLAEKGMIELPIRSNADGGHFTQWYAVMRACCNAYYDRFSDRTERSRVERLLEDKEIEYQIDAIKKLQQFYKKNWDFVYLPARRALETLSSINENTIRFPQFTQFLDQYGAGLQKKLDELNGKPPSGEKDFWPYGGLMFPGDRSYGLSIERKGDIEIQSLLFHLAYIFCHITSNNVEGLESLDCRPMPTTGKPSYALVADIANIVLEESDKKEHDEVSVRKIVDRLVQKKAQYFDPELSESKYHIFAQDLL
jgi:hypothetical protein